MPYYPEPPHADDIAERGTKQWRQAVKAHQDWIGNEGWTAHHRDGLDLGNTGAIQNWLASLGVTNEVGGGRHAYRMFTGDLPANEMGGMSGRGIPYAFEATMPDWARFRDYTIQGGNPRGATDQMYFPWLNGSMNQPSQTPAMASSFGSPQTTPTPGLSGGTPTYGASGMGGGNDAWASAQEMLRKRRPGNTLGSLSGYGG